jgi:hypothetical protein
MANPPVQNPSPASRSAAEAGKKDAGARVRIPMSVPRRKLQTPELPGYHLHWFLEENVFLAQQAFYEFVKTDELHVNQFNPASALGMSGSADMGTNICIIGNKVGATGKPEMQYLMKLKLEYWDEDARKLEELNAAKLGAIFRGERILAEEQGKVPSEDRGLSYVDKDRTSMHKPLFHRPTRRERG